MNNEMKTTSVTSSVEKGPIPASTSKCGRLQEGPIEVLRLVADRAEKRGHGISAFPPWNPFTVSFSAGFDDPAPSSHPQGSRKSESPPAERMASGSPPEGARL